MSNVALVEHAAEMARSLIQREARGPGDTDNAMRRVADEYGVPYTDLWKLRYRKPKRIYADVLLALANAFEAQREAQLKRLEHERAITKVKGRLSSYLVAASDALARTKIRGSE